jgi:hypothetical protein
LADVPVIVQRGAQWWKDQGSGDSVGWKFFAVSGHVVRPDVYVVPMGTTVRELIELAGGVTDGAAVGAVQPGGASSNLIGPDQLDLRLDFDTCREGRHHAGIGRRRGDGRRHEPARRVDERVALLPQRVVREVRAVPRRFDEGPRTAPSHRRVGIVDGR